MNHLVSLGVGDLQLGHPQLLLIGGRLLSNHPEIEEFNFLLDVFQKHLAYISPDMLWPDIDDML